MIDIKDFKYHIVCDFDNRNIAKHSIGMVNAPAELRINVSTQSLIEIITEGLKRLTDEEKAEILKDYLPVSVDIEQESKKFFESLSKEEFIALLTNAGYELQEVTQQEVNTGSLQEQEGLQNNPAIETIIEGENEAQKLDKEAEESNPQKTYRDTLLAKAQEVGVEGKYATFTNAMLKKEIEKKLGGK